MKSKMTFESNGIVELYRYCHKNINAEKISLIKQQ